MTVAAFLEGLLPRLPKLASIALTLKLSAGTRKSVSHRDVAFCSRMDEPSSLSPWSTSVPTRVLVPLSAS